MLLSCHPCIAHSPSPFGRVGFLDSRLSLLLGSSLMGALRALLSGITSACLFDDGSRDLTGKVSCFFELLTRAKKKISLLSVYSDRKGIREQ